MDRRSSNRRLKLACLKHSFYTELKPEGELRLPGAPVCSANLSSDAFYEEEGDMVDELKPPQPSHPCEWSGDADTGR
jgi:hypothetical protein